MYTKILVAVNDNERAFKALGYAVEMSEKLEAQLFVLFVHKDNKVEGDRKNAIFAAEVNKIKEKIRKQYPHLPERAQLIMRDGKNIASIIVSVAQEIDSDLIVLGSRRLSGANSVIRRSVANAVISGSVKPVLII